MRSLACCQLSCWSHTWSARSSAYGIQPICASEYASLSFGNSISLAENSQSAIDAIALLNASVPPTPPGASGDAAGFVEDEPMCMHSVTPLSLQTWNIESHSPLWIVGSFKWWGSSLKQIARQPLSAMRCTSFAARSTSHNGIKQSGMFTPLDGWHHSSIIQLLYASTHARPSSLSLPS